MVTHLSEQGTKINTFDINTSFDVYSDTPKGKDPDTNSPTLRKFHQILWGKELPGGEASSAGGKQVIASS